MKLFSLNCNKFAGCISDGKGEYFDADILRRIVWIVQLFLDLDDDNLVILHEVNYRSEPFQMLRSALERRDFTLYLPTMIDAMKYHNKAVIPYGCTVAITRKQTTWKQSPSLEVDQRNHSYGNKSVILNHHDMTVVGIHMPYDQAYWNRLTAYVKNALDRDMILIGDMNTFDEGTWRKEKLKQLLSYGMIDAWTASGKENEKATCNTEKRLDYALMTKKAYASLQAIRIMDSIRKEGISDHSAIMVERNG